MGINQKIVDRYFKESSLRFPSYTGSSACDVHLKVAPDPSTPTKSVEITSYRQNEYDNSRSSRKDWSAPSLGVEGSTSQKGCVENTIMPTANTTIPALDYVAKKARDPSNAGMCIAQSEDAQASTSRNTALSWKRSSDGHCSPTKMSTTSMEYETTIGRKTSNSGPPVNHLDNESRTKSVGPERSLLSTDICSPTRVMARFRQAREGQYFLPGDIVLFGKYKNHKGKILNFSKDKWGNPTVIIEPIPKGRKQNKEFGLFKIWRADVKEKALAEQKAEEEAKNVMASGGKIEGLDFRQYFTIFYAYDSNQPIVHTDKSNPLPKMQALSRKGYFEPFQMSFKITPKGEALAKEYGDPYENGTKAHGVYFPKVASSAERVISRFRLGNAIRSFHTRSAVPLPAELANHPALTSGFTHVNYSRADGSLGFIDGGSWIAWVDFDGTCRLWTSRDPGGGIIGDPYIFRRDDLVSAPVLTVPNPINRMTGESQ